MAVTERSCTPRFVATVATPAVRHEASAARTISGGVAPLSSEANTSRVVGLDRERLAVGVLLAETGEVGDRRAAVGAVHPLAAGPPLELRGLGRVGQRLAGAAQRLDVHAVVDGRGVGLGHVGSSRFVRAAADCRRSTPLSGDRRLRVMKDEVVIR